jgi:hypothetical protein
MRGRADARGGNHSEWADTLEDWFSLGGGDDVTAANKEHMRAADVVLLGRVTYLPFASFWPKQTGDTTGVHDYLNRTAKYVVSSSPTKADWQNTSSTGMTLRLPGRPRPRATVVLRQTGTGSATGRLSAIPLECGATVLFGCGRSSALTVKDHHPTHMELGKG